MAAAVGGNITYFVGGDGYAGLSLWPPICASASTSGCSFPHRTLSAGVTPTDVVDYIDWSEQPATVRQLMPLPVPRRQAAAAYAAGNLVVGGG